MINSRLLLFVGFVIVVLNSCGGVCNENGTFCPKSDNMRTLKAAFEVGDYWVLENKIGTIRDSIYVTRISGDLDDCMQIKNSCTLFTNASDVYLAGTIFGKDILRGRFIYQINKDNVEFDGISFDFAPGVFQPKIGDIDLLNNELIRFRVLVDSTYTKAHRDTNINGIELQRCFLLGGNIPLFDLDLGFVELVTAGDTIRVTRSSNM